MWSLEVIIALNEEAHRDYQEKEKNKEKEKSKNK